MRFTQPVGLLLVGSAIFCAGGIAADAAALPDLKHSVETKPTGHSTKPPRPAVKGQRGRDGLRLDAEINETLRLKSSRKLKSNRDRDNGDTPIDDRRRRITKHSFTRNEFRLNLGICGRLDADGTTPGPTRCQPEIPVPPRPTVEATPVPTVQPPRPVDVSWEMVFNESKDVVFPKLGVKVQPAGRTLVNLDTIVYTDDSRVSTHVVTLLGFPVVVEATPTSYTWNFGDGKSITTTSPGKPYPSKEITHKYLKRGSAKLALTTHYSARFNVADTGWQYIDGAVSVTGPVTDLQIREAVPVLVEPPR